MGSGLFTSPEKIIMHGSAVITLLLLLFAVDWRYFRDWVAVFLFVSAKDLALASMIVESGHIAYPVRYLPNFFDTSLLYEVWVLPTLCVLYNQLVRAGGPVAAIFYALVFSAAITFAEYPLELYTGLLKYTNWHWYWSFFSISGILLASRIFLAFYRWGCDYFGRRLF